MIPICRLVPFRIIVLLVMILLFVLVRLIAVSSAPLRFPSIMTQSCIVTSVWLFTVIALALPTDCISKVMLKPEQLKKILLALMVKQLPLACTSAINDVLSLTTLQESARS